MYLNKGIGAKRYKTRNIFRHMTNLFAQMFAYIRSCGFMTNILFSL